MVGKTRAQKAKAAGKSFKDDSAPPNSIQVRIQEVVAYFEVQAENEGMIDVTKDIYDKVNEIVDHYGRTRDYIKQSSVNNLLSCMISEPVVPNLSPKALLCLLNLLIVSGSSEYRALGLRILLDILRHKGTASVLVLNIDGNDGSDSQIDTIENALRESLQERIEWKSNDEETRQIMLDVLTEFLENTPILTTESPLDAKSLANRSDNQIDKTELNGKRKRNEIPDSFEDLSIFDFPIDQDLEELADSWSSHESGLAQTTICNQTLQEKIPPKVHMNQKRQRKRLKRVTETGSPIPVTESTPKQDLISAKRYFPDLNSLRDSSNGLFMDKPHEIPSQPQLAADVVEIPRANEVTQKPSKDSNQPANQEMKQFERSTAQSNRSEIPASQTQEVHSCVQIPVHHTSPQEPGLPHADQIVFDQYLDFDGGVTILSQYPENIFSSPERPTLVRDPNASKNLIVASGTCPPILLQPAELPLDSTNDEPKTVTPSASPVGINPKDPQEEPILFACSANLPQQKDVSGPASPPSRHFVIEAVADETAKHQALPVIHSEIKPVCTPNTTYTPKDPELAQSKISQITTINAGKDRQNSDGSTPCKPSVENVSVSQVRQLVVSEVEKAVKGIGAYLCSVNYRDLAFGQFSSHSAKAKDISYQNHIFQDLNSRTDVSNQMQDECNILEVLRPLHGLGTQGLDLGAHADPDKTFQSHTVHLDTLIDCSGTRQEDGLSSSTIDSNRSSPSLSAIIPSHTVQQMIEQVQGLDSKITPIFLQAMALVTNAFRPLNSSPDVLNCATSRYDTIIQEHAINQTSVTLDQGYQKKLQISLSQVGSAIHELEKLQSSYERQSGCMSHQFEKHSKPISLIDLAIKSMQK